MFPVDTPEGLGCHDSGFWGSNQRVCRGLECTGTLIGPKHVVTAAHCVFDINDSRQYVSSLNFAPGEENQNDLPFGTAQWSSVRVLSQFTSQVWQRLI